MSILRAYDGPDPGHPVGVVPEDPERRGALVRVRGWEIAVADPDDVVESVADLSTAAGEIGWDQMRLPGIPPFDGGLLGFITDEATPELMGLPADRDERPAPAALPSVWFGRYGAAACRAPEGGWWLAGQTSAAIDHAEELLRDAAAAQATATEDSSSHAGFVPPREDRVAWSSIDASEHAAAVDAIKGWIARGDVYQVNLTLHVGAPWNGSPRALAWALFGANDGAAHAAFLHAPGGATIASVSPETFLRVDGRFARTRPIKGTRRRAADPAQDRQLSQELQAAAKDRAEHVMIVDLERNDLGRISEVGSVEVPELMALEAHPTVWHLTSTVQGTLRADADMASVLAALFPCGSVTGAPKRMAVTRTRLVEPWQRGVYCGAIGVITHGLVDLSVAIRTAVMHQGRAWYGTGGGIVADSDPAAEWDEAMGKAAAFFTATNTTPPR